MKSLNMDDVNQVSGGDVAVSVNVTVPTAALPAFSTALSGLLTGPFAATDFANAVTANAGVFNTIPIDSINVGNFVITPV